MLLLQDFSSFPLPDCLKKLPADFSLMQILRRNWKRFVYEI